MPGAVRLCSARPCLPILPRAARMPLAGRCHAQGSQGRGRGGHRVMGARGLGQLYQACVNVSMAPLTEPAHR